MTCTQNYMRKFPGVINLMQIWVSWLVVVKPIKGPSMTSTETFLTDTDPADFKKCTPETGLGHLSGKKKTEFCKRGH